MAVLKYYDGSDWEPVVSALQGPTGATGVTGATGSTGPTGPNPGLTLINTTSFSGVTSVSLPADTFTSTYENYRIIYKFTPVNSDAVFARLRASGSDATAAQYNPAMFFARTGGTTGVSSSLANQTSAVFESIVAGQKNHLILDVVGPKLAEYTTVTSHHLMGVSASDQKSLFGGFQLSNTTAYDSMSLIMGSGNFSGKVSAYGYNL
jgi:hypothetical protein